MSNQDSLRDWNEQTEMMQDMLRVVREDTLLNCVREDLVALVKGMHKLGYRKNGGSQ